MTDRETLLRLAERGQRRGADEVIARLEARLEGRTVVGDGWAGSGRLGARVPGSAVDRTLGGRPQRLVIPPRRRRVALVAVAAAGLVLVLLGGAALLSRLIGEETPPVVTQPEESPGTTVVDSPPGVEVGDQQAFETSLGRWVWTRVEWEGPGPPMPSVIPDHEAEWSALPSPQLPQIDATEWRWHPANPRADSARFGEVTVTPASVGGHVDWTLLYSYEPGWVEARWDWACYSGPAACPTHGSILEIVGMQDFPDPDGLGGEHREMEVLARIEVKVVSGDPDAVELRDQDTGELVLRLEATDPEVSVEQLLRAARTCNFFGCGTYLWKLHVDGLDPAWVDPPWFGVPIDTVAVAAGAQGFVIVGIDGMSESPTLHTWRSLDGVAWEPLGPPLYPEVARGSYVRLLLVGDGSLLVLVIEEPATPASQVWTSTDGSDWHRAEIDVAQANVEAVARTSSAWVIVGFRHLPSATAPACELWVSADAVTWEPIALPIESRRATYSGCNLAGDTVELITEFIRPSDGFVREDFQLWFGGFEE